MNRLTTDKWIEGVSPNDRTSEVAARALQSRLKAVLTYLPLAAEKAGEDVEYVHQLRVWARRADAAVRLYGDLIPRRRRTWLGKQLRRVRRAANDARDCDVLIRRLQKKRANGGAKHWLEEVRAERETAQRAVVVAHARLGHGHRFARRIDKIVQRVRRRGTTTAWGLSLRFGDWARGRLRPLLEECFAAAPADAMDEAALHQFRIRGKELRYAMELLAGAFPDSFRTELYPAVEALQDRLGEINDMATAKARLQRKVEVAESATATASWERLLANEQAKLDQTRQQFWEWCTPQTLADLRDRFEALLATPGGEEAPVLAPSQSDHLGDVA